MADIKALRDAAAELVRERVKINDAAAAAGQLEFGEDQQAAFDKLGAELKTTTAAIEREETLEADIKALSARSTTRQAGTPGNPPDDKPPPEEEPKFDSFGCMLQAVAQAGMTGGARVDERLTAPLAEVSGLSEGVGSDGGFLVGVETTNELLKATYETGILASRCSRTPIGPGKNTLKINGIDETSRADGSQFGGVVVYWESEAALKTASKPKFRQVELSLHKLIGLCYATDELLQDAVALEALIMEAFPLAFGFKVDDGIVRGTGAGQIRGILTGAVDAPRVRVAKETGQKANTIVAENVEKMYARMWARGLGNAVWTINQDCWPQIFQLHHVIGVGGVPMFVPAGGLNQTPFGTLLGRPILPIEQAATLGQESDIMFSDYSQFKLIDKGGIQSASSIHVRFTYDESVFRFVLRTDGQPMWASALTPAQGTNKVSPFITLQTRA